MFLLLNQLDYSLNCSSETRGWSLLVLGVIGAYISIRTYKKANNQRKLENTFKTLDYLRKHISEEQIQTFIELFHANNELQGIQYNEFVFENGKKDLIEDMFSEGGCGNGDIHNMIELFNMLCPTFDKIELKLVWYEYGQIMSGIYKWTKYLEENCKQDFDSQFFKTFNEFMKEKQSIYRNYSSKYYVYIE
jgi:hypothetical protein